MCIRDSVEEVSQHPVIEFRREDLKEAHCADGLAHLEALAFAEIEGSGRDEVLAAESRPGYHVKGEAERLVRCLLYTSPVLTSPLFVRT